MSISGINTLQATRKYTLSIVDGLGEAALLKIPAGFKTNIFWNIGHILASQQILHYSLAGVPPRLDEAIIGRFRKGTSPSGGDGTEIAAILGLFLKMPEYLQEDYAAKKFDRFKTYPTSSGFVLENIDDSIAYNNFHEGLHLGIIQSILKFI